jgi:hypothetical protein
MMRCGQCVVSSRGRWLQPASAALKMRRLVKRARRPNRPEWGAQMPSHKFKIGEKVMLKGSVSRNVPGGVYEVVKQLPYNGHEFEHSIKSSSQSHERVA